MDIKQLIIEKLKNASLPDFQMTLWVDVLDSLSEEQAKDILNFTEADNRAISILTKNLIEKEQVIRSGDIEQFEQTLKNDISVVNSV